MGKLAAAHQLYLAGSLLEQEQGRVYNTHALYGPEGLLAHYRKIHLFRLMAEHTYLAPGEAPTLQRGLPWGPVGLATCYDLRFPELFRGYAVAGARLILVPAEWPAPRIDHWRTLVRARAIENQCFVAACNRVGADPNNRFAGASTIVGPWGEVLLEGDDTAGLLLAEVDPEGVDAARERIPVLSDRRPACYEL
jgi:predicted amidohydrolase